METLNNVSITIEANINAPVEKVWEFWTDPKHITRWYNASEDWHAPYAENDLKVGGKFKTTMAAKDGSFSFDFEGTYTKIEDLKIIDYTLADARKVSVTFIPEGNTTKVVEKFDPEDTHSLEMQQEGWQAILNNFKKYTETNLS